MDNNETISYLVHEADMCRQERVIVRLWVLCIILIILLVSTNALWIWYESQFEDVVTTIEAEQDGSGVNIVGGGDVNYGTEGESDYTE